MLHKQLSPRTRNKTVGNLGSLQRGEVGSERGQTGIDLKVRVHLSRPSRCVYTSRCNMASVGLCNIYSVVHIVSDPL